MIRRLKFTGRIRIQRNDLHIDLFDRNGKRHFDARLNLTGYGLPENAHVFIDAYHRTGFERFSFGMVQNIAPQSDCVLTQFDNQTIPLFRIKVVDRIEKAGRILASMERVRPNSLNGMDLGAESLLWIEYVDLGERIWVLDLEGVWPTLQVNSRIPDIHLLISTDPQFSALVYPEAYRQVLRRILISDKFFDPNMDDDWPSLWLNFALSLVPREPLTESTAIAELNQWIEDVVNAFSRKSELFLSYVKSIQIEE